jgi:hypothetical protein
VIADNTDDIISSDQEEVLFVPQVFHDKDVARVPKLTPFVENVCEYIAGYVTRVLIPKLKCSECRQLLVASVDHVSYALIELKDNGGLIHPVREVVRIVKLAKQKVRQLIPVKNAVHSLSRLGKQLEHSVMKELDVAQMFDRTPHFLDSADGIDNHVSSLVRQIIRSYVDIRRDYLVKTWNMEQRGVVVRQSMNKTVLFKNQ